MKKRVVFDFQLNGHNMEYLHHLYIGARDDCENHYIFSVPQEFEESKTMFEWPEASNIEFRYFDIKRIASSSDILISLKSCIYLRKLIKETKADDLILVWLMSVIPFLPFFISSKVEVVGIIYRLYLYRWKESSIWEKISNAIKYFCITHSKCIRKAFVLNDSSSVAVLNKVWKTSKYHYLADPYIGFEDKHLHDLRGELKINKQDKVYLHIGAMSYRKGTLNVLRMIENSRQEDLNDKFFIFAGNVGDSIKREFYQKVKVLSQRDVKFIVKDDFLPYEYFGSLIYSSDCLLLPYNNPDMSSGTIAYAAQFHKPCYAPQKGLLGKLVRKYRIGKTIKSFDSIDDVKDTTPIESNYCIEHTVKKFNQTLLDIHNI